MRRIAPTPISRREFMRVSGVAAAGAVVVACGAGGEPEPMQEAAPADDSAAEAAPAASSSQYSEAPMLADMVAAGDLPPVDERLPVNPMVMPVSEDQRRLRRHIPPRLQGRLRPLGADEDAG